MCGCYFFFQAEDGIRDLVRSRGLGDVYKRQGQCFGVGGAHDGEQPDPPVVAGCRSQQVAHRLEAVSYTHLTLPTSDLA